MPPISAPDRRPPPRGRARDQVNYCLRRATMETAERARHQWPRARRYFHLVSRLPCEIGFWARSLACNRRRVQRTGHRELLLPRIGSAQKMRSCWRRRLKKGYPSSCRPKALRSRTSILLKVSAQMARRLARRMNPAPIQWALIRACSRWRRHRNRDHLRLVMQQPCLLCGRKPSDAHHIRFVQPRALGRKASDEFAVLLCHSHHRAVHRAGDEKAWWKQAGIDPIKVARKLWKHTRIDEGRIEPEPTAQGTTADRPAKKRRSGGALHRDGESWLGRPRHQSTLEADRARKSLGLSPVRDSHGANGLQR